MTTHWVVLLEAAGDSHAPVVDLRELEGLVHEVAEMAPVALHRDDRYALQLSVAAPGPVEALSSAIGRWAEAVQSLCLPPWALVRLEVISSIEHQRECSPESGLGDDWAEEELDADDRADDPAGELLRRAFWDPLTDLPGNEAFCDAVDRRLALGKGGPSSVLRVKIAHLAPLLADVGPAIADLLVVSLAEGIGQRVRPGDVLARLDDDEFAVFLPGTPGGKAAEVAERILSALRMAAMWPGRGAAVRATIGIGSRPLPAAAHQLLRDAGDALASAERAGEGGWCVFAGTGTPAHGRARGASPGLSAGGGPPGPAG